MPQKPRDAGGPTIRPIGFYPDDDARIERIRERLSAADPTRNVKIADVVRWALADAAGRIEAPAKTHKRKGN